MSSRKGEELAMMHLIFLITGFAVRESFIYSNNTSRL
jgi:hypothetical protein